MKQSLYTAILLVTISMLIGCGQPQEDKTDDGLTEDRLKEKEASEEEAKPVEGFEALGKSTSDSEEEESMKEGLSGLGEAAGKVKVALGSEDFIERDCEKAEGKEACYYTMAVEKADASFCDKMQGTDLFIPKEICYIDVATNTNDETVCEKIDIPETRENCKQSVIDGKDGFYLRRALETLDTSLCEKIESDSMFISKKGCLDAVDNRMQEEIEKAKKEQ